MPRRRRDIAPGSRVTVYERGHGHLGILVRYVDTSRGREALVHVDGEPGPRNVAVWAISPNSRGTRWWWPDSASGRVAVLGLAVAILAAIPGYFALLAGDRVSSNPGTDPSSGTSTAPTAASANAQHVSLSGSLQVVDASFGRRWGTYIQADATDTLQFVLHLHNDATKATPMLALLPVLVRPMGPGLQTYVVRVAAGPPSALRFVNGAYVRLAPQSNGFDRLNAGDFHADFGDGRQRTLSFQGSVNTAALPADTWRVSAFAMSLGSLSAHQSVVVRFTGSIRPPSEDPQLATGPVVRFLRAGTDERSRTTGTAAPGDRLVFGVQYDNPTFGGSDVHARVSIKAHTSTGFATVAAYGQFPEMKEERIGEAIVNASRATAIRLVVVRGSTRLQSYDGPTCDRLHHRGKLSDGIQQGGIDIGLVGGFRPRDPCSGTGFTRYVVFTVRVLRA